jgi:hypothetical protein
VVTEKTYQVDIPAGVDTGSTLRLTGRGAVGPRSGSAGDLYVHIRVAAHERFVRDGDDLFVGAGKLSISIATVTPVSSLIHFAVNATAGGAPVATSDLQALSVAPAAFAQALLSRVAAEQASILTARAKVRAKGEWR